VKLKGRFVFSTAEVLQIAKEAEEVTAAKKAGRKRKARPISLEIEDEVEDVLNSDPSDSSIDCIVIANTRIDRR